VVKNLSREPDAGELTERITIEKYTPTRTPAGQEIPGWKFGETRWARNHVGSSTEAWRARQIFPEVTGVFILRGYLDVTPRDRIVCGLRRFDILAVTDPFGGKEPLRAEWLHISYREGQTKGS